MNVCRIQEEQVKLQVSIVDRINTVYTVES